MIKKPKIIILGAGMSGIACALKLNNNFDVHIYEKSRGIGGRLCAKTLPGGLFHFGAQFCTAQSSSFQNFLKQNNATNFIGTSFDFKTNACIETKNYFVGKNGMHTLLKNYENSLNIHFGHQAIKINEEKKIVYFNSGKKESYDIIISSLPLPQAQKIFKTKINHDSIFSPCIAMGMTLKGAPIYEHNAYKNINKDVAFLGSSRFYNDQKKETWVLQFTPKASVQMINQLDESLQSNADINLRNVIYGNYEIVHAGTFRWKYALCSRSNHKDKFISISNNAFAIGDWNISPRVESAYISGNALAEYLTEIRA